MSLRLVPIIDGPDNQETILFIQGWPDDASLWDPAVEVLSPTYRCARVTLPNYGGDRTTRWGYRTEEIVDALVQVLRDVSRGRRVTLILHDWGCYWGHAVHHRCPELVSRVAGFDVAPHFKPSALGVAGIITYQGYLAAAFAAGDPVGTWMTRRLAKLVGAPAPSERLNAWMNYPYRNIWGDLAMGRAKKLTESYWPTCPLLFVYGEKKPFQFHSEAWVDHVRKVGGKVVGLPSGHWVMKNPSFLAVLVTWLTETRAHSVAA